MNTCIWCLNNGHPKSIEHIIPESLGCPPGWLLENGEICTKCNNSFSILDESLIHLFEIPLFFNGIPKKKNRPPSITRKNNLFAQMRDNKPEYYINMEKHPIHTPSGQIVPSKNINSLIDIKSDIDFPYFNITINQKLHFNKKISRGLHKIAFESLVKFIGIEEGLKEYYCFIRDYVRFGKGKRTVLYSACNDKEFRNHVYNPYISPDGSYLLILRLVNLEFVINLGHNDDEMIRLLEAANKHYGDNIYSHF